MRKQNKKERLNCLKNLCLRYFGETYKDWSWEAGLNGSFISNGDFIHNGTYYYKAAIELPKKLKDGTPFYTDPFIATANGTSKARDIAAECAINFIKRKFQNY